MKQRFGFLLLIILLIGLFSLPVLAQDDPSPTVQATTITATITPDGAADSAQDITFNLPDTNTVGWREGVIIALLLLVGVQFYIANGSVPLPVLNGLFGLARGFSQATPGTTDDNAVEWAYSMIKPGLDPKRWPTLIQDLVPSGILSAMAADELIAHIAAQKLPPQRAYNQAEALTQFYRARQTVAVAQRGTGAPIAGPGGFLNTVDDQG